MKKMFILLLAVAVFAGISQLPALAEGRGGCEKRGGKHCAISEKLKLTKEQKVKFEEIQTECEKAMIKGKADIETTRIDLYALLKKEKIDKAAVDAKVNELGDLIKKGLKNRIECKVKLLSILDAEQKKEFLESDCHGEGEHHFWGKERHHGDEGEHRGCEREREGGGEMKGKHIPEKE